jgi:acyl-CoA thioester hydrolase
VSGSPAEPAPPAAPAAAAVPLTTSLQLRWADTDAYGHVNNVTWVEYLEETRIRLFGLPDAPSTADPRRPPVFSVFGPGVFTVTAATRIEYAAELPYHVQSVIAEGWISRIGTSSVDVSVRILDEARTTVHLRAESTQAMRDVATRAAHRFDERERTALAAHLAPPHEFR